MRHEGSRDEDEGMSDDGSEKMRRNNKPRGIQKHAESRVQRIALTCVRGLLSPPLSDRHSGEGLAMPVCRFVASAMLARTLAAERSSSAVIQITAGITYYYAISPNERRAKSYIYSHDDTQQCWMIAPTIPQKSPPPLPLLSPWHELVAVLGCRALQVGMPLVPRGMTHPWCWKEIKISSPCFSSFWQYWLRYTVVCGHPRGRAPTTGQCCSVQRPAVPSTVCISPSSRFEGYERTQGNPRKYFGLRVEPIKLKWKTGCCVVCPRRPSAICFRRILEQKLHACMKGS